MSAEAVFLEGEKVVLQPLGRDDVSPDYLTWLNDAEVLRYRGPKAFPTTLAQLASWIDGLPGRGDLVLAIRTKERRRHIGNIALNSILWTHHSAELSVMIGAKDVWGKGYASEAIEMIAAHAFATMGLHRVWAESPNPAFNAVVHRLGWTEEGVKRESFLLDGAWVDIRCWSLLDREWRAAKGRNG
jgi:RimJ/RimL family protein N-acetyltransferase